MAKFDLMFGRSYDPLNPEDVAEAITSAANDILKLRGKEDAIIKQELRGFYGSVSARLRTLARQVDDLAMHPGQMVRPVMPHFAGIEAGVPKRIAEFNTSYITEDRELNAAAGNSQRRRSAAATAASFPRASKRP
jgi:hypothetical protein